MKIFFITPEAVPFSRAGGLGDVSYHLPKAFHDVGHQVTVIVPDYGHHEKHDVVEIPEWSTEIDLSISKRRACYSRAQLSGAHNAILVGCPGLFDRDGIYGNEFGDYDDNAERFIFFSRAALMATNRMADPNEETIIHCHDWSTGLVLMCLKSWRDSMPNLKNAGLVFTYHNLANQGLFLHYDFAMTSLDWNLFTFEGLEFHGKMNLTKAGLLAADQITTVSKKYFFETMTPEMGHGLEGLLSSRQADITPVLNGVDYSEWNPATDPHIAAKYSTDDMSGKNICRKALSSLFNFSDPSRPIVAMICRLLPRKGLDIIVKSMDRLLELPINMVFTGTGEARYQMFLSQYAAQNQGKLGVSIDYNLPLDHQIIAGADIFIMPSRFEPCGLEQLYALKYGTVPVVRNTGGLDDTVVDVRAGADIGTGYKFDEYCPDTFLDTLLKAVSDYYGDKKHWHALMRRGMTQNFSWRSSAEAYLEIYQKTLDQVTSKERKDVANP